MSHKETEKYNEMVKEYKQENETIQTKFKRGDKVEVNGNKEGRILDYYMPGMVEVRLWHGNRHVGDICIDEIDVKLLEDTKNVK